MKFIMTKQSQQHTKGHISHLLKARAITKHTVSKRQKKSYQKAKLEHFDLKCTAILSGI